ncbi:murein L,D-transpeptidase YafK [Rhizobium sp. SG_E_25_P2]|nr:murein L,D-transpeptidase YafK [Rhizobium sp. SG_E_25_P2]
MIPGPDRALEVMADMVAKRIGMGLALALALGALTGCTQETLEIVAVNNRVEHPLPAKMQQKLRKLNISVSSPIMMRIFKEEEVMEIWKADMNNRYQLVATYPICAWSGQLGPKKKEGDRQAPEGFYTVSPGQMNPNSSYYLSFNIGYPNKYDRAYGRSGSNLMVHGACSSAGCYSMSDAAVLQIYAFAREAFRGGQKAFQIQAYPFRMTAENMAKHRHSEHYPFWQNLKTGYDYFEITKRPPEVEVCEKKYVFNQVGGRFSAAGKCPADSTPQSLLSAYATYDKTYQTEFAKATIKWGPSDWKDVAEFDRKAQERLARRMGKKKAIPNDAEYVLVDPSAKLTPTSDTVTSYSAAYAKVEAIKNNEPPKVEYISVAELEARKKAADAKRKEEERLAKAQGRVKAPIPQPNPIKPVMQAAAQPAAENDNTVWSFFRRKPPQSMPTQQASADPAAAMGSVATTASTPVGKTARTSPAAAAPATVAGEVATVEQPAAAPQSVPAADQKKPFWKVW